jgi:hypothetical protein
MKPVAAPDWRLLAQHSICSISPVMPVGYKTMNNEYLQNKKIIP